MKLILVPADLMRIKTVGKLSAKNNPSLYCRVSKGNSATSDTLIATTTDGRRMHRITVPCTVIDGDFKESFVLPPLTIKIPTKLPLVSIEVNTDNVVYTLGTTQEICPVEAEKPPDLDKYIPTDTPQVTIRLNPAYMEAAFAAFSVDEVVTMEVRGPNTPIIIRTDVGGFALVATIKKDS